MKKGLRYLLGGIISTIIGYIGYIIVFYYAKYRLIEKLSPEIINKIEEITIMGSIPSLGWFIIYTLIFFVAGLIVVFIIDKIKKRR